MDEAQVRLCIKTFLEPEQITEVRVLRFRGRVYTKCFSGDEAETLLDWIRPFGDAGGIYFIPNPLTGKIIGSATDKHIDRRRWLLIDFDPVRPTQVSSTDAEKERALKVCMKVKQRLGDKVIMADSGNGYHLCYHWNAPNDPHSRHQASTFLKVVSRLYSTPEVEIDTSVFNAARIWKLYGTMSRKGEATHDRPHRLSRIIERSLAFGYDSTGTRASDNGAPYRTNEGDGSRVGRARSSDTDL